MSLWWCFGVFFVNTIEKYQVDLCFYGGISFRLPMLKLIQCFKFTLTFVLNYMSLQISTCICPKLSWNINILFKLIEDHTQYLSQKVQHIVDSVKGIASEGKNLKSSNRQCNVNV